MSMTFNTTGNILKITDSEIRIICFADQTADGRTSTESISFSKLISDLPAPVAAAVTTALTHMQDECKSDRETNDGYIFD